MGIKISNLPTASETQTTDIVPIVQDGTTKKIQQSVLFKNLNDGMTELNNEMTDLDSRLEEAIAEFSTPLKYKGQVQTFNDLPVNADNGDIYSVVSENKNYVWNGTEWIEYSQTINIDDEIKTTLTTQEASETEITNIAGVNGKIDVSGNSVQKILLPDEYQEVEYIDFTGTQYIDTGIKPTNTIGCYAKAKPSSGTGDRILTGSSDGNRFYIYLPTGTETKFAIGWNTNIIYNYIIDYTTNYEILLNYKNNRKVTINGNDLATNLEQFTGNNKNIYIGCANGSSGATAFYKGTLNVLQITNNNEIIRNFIPCYRKTDNVIGMYDTVSNTFFTNAGTGTFEKGNDVSGDYLLSPTYPIPIRNVGDNVNLFNINGQVDLLGNNGEVAGLNSVSNGILTTNSNSASGHGVGQKIIKLNGKTITFSAELLSVGTSSTNKAMILIYDDGSAGNKYKLGSVGERISITYTCTSDNIICAFSTQNGTGAQFKDIQVKISGTELPYSPYNCGNANIEVSGNQTQNNWATTYVSRINDSSKATITTFDSKNCLKYESNAGYNDYDNKYFYKDNFKVNTSYKVSFNQYKLYNAGINLAFVYTDGTYEYFTPNITLEINKWQHIEVYSNPNKTLKYIRNRYSYDGYTYIEINSFIISEFQLKTFPFKENQRLYEGDYLASDGIHHKRGKDVYDGSNDEGWTLQSINDSGIANFKLSTYYHSIIHSAICNRFIAQTTSIVQTTTEGILWQPDDFYIRIKSTTASTVAEFKTWLSNNPIIVEYKLKNEEIEPYTPEQEEAYWQLQHCLMYEGYTKIQCIDEIKCKFKVEYSYNNELNTYYGGRIDSLEYKIHQLENAVNNLSQ